MPSSITKISVDNVDVNLLNKQRTELHQILLQVAPQRHADIWGLLGLLEHICDTYQHLIEQTTCNCECGCEVPLDWGTCGDCGEGTHQNNNELSEYRN